MAPVDQVQWRGGEVIGVQTSGVLTRTGDPTHKQKAVYSLTDKGIGLLPVLTALSAWGQKHYPETRLPDAVALVKGGEEAQRRMATALRKEHLR